MASENQSPVTSFERILLSVLFVLMFGFEPLFTSNQNTKFLHGFAENGFGFLARDWVAQTADPLPVFTALVELLAGVPFVFYVLQAILTWIYAYFFLLLADRFLNITTRHQLWLFAVLFFLLHSPILLSDLYWGFSSQYLFTQYLQPSSFSVLYIPFFYYFLKKKYVLSALFLGLPGLIHSAYTLVGAVIFISCFSYILLKERRWSATILSGLVFSAIMIPAVIYQVKLLGATSPGLTQDAMHILSTYRIPHHTSLSSIFRFDFAIKMVFLIGGIFLTVNQKIKWVLTWLTAFLIVSILYSWFNQNAVTSVSTPWRFSVILVPLGFIVAFASSVNRLKEHLQKPLFYLSIAGILILSIGGVVWTTQSFLNQTTAPGSKALEWINDNQDQFETATFLVENQADYSDHFRLRTGVPIFVNWKTHPYKDFEVIEWYKRVQLNDQFYNKELSSENLAQFLKAYKISHALVPADFELSTSKIIYEDGEMKIITFNLVEE